MLQQVRKINYKFCHSEPLILYTSHKIMVGKQFGNGSDNF